MLISGITRTTTRSGVPVWPAGLAGGIVLTALLILLLTRAPIVSAQSPSVLPDAKWLDFFCIGWEECAVGDFNGDGKDDLLAFVRDTRAGNEQGDVYVALSTGSGFQPATKWHDFFCVGPEVCKVGDFNGDGKDDIIAFVRSGYSGDAAGDVYVALSTGAGFLPSSRWHTFFCVGQEVCDIGDFNGDGKTDIVSFARSSYSGDAQGDVYVALSSGTGFGAGARWHTFFCILQEQCGTGDFNGDGKDDIVSFTRGSNGAVYVALSSGSSFGSGVKWHNFFCVGEEVCGVGDFDGDGKDDIITFLRNGYDATTLGDVYVGLSSGSSFRSGVLWHDYFCIGQQVCGTGDFNGDRRSDIVAFLRDTQGGDARGDVYVALATGSPYRFEVSRQWHDYFCIGQEQCAVGDFNGDGRDDILAFVRDTQGGAGQGDVYVALSTGLGFGPLTKWHDFFCTGGEVCTIGDFNGDGRDDIIAFVRSSKTDATQGDVYVALSDGASFGPRTLWNTFFCLGNEICDVGDFNGDGRDDIITFMRSAYSGDPVGDVYVGLSNGYSFAGGVKWHNFFCIQWEQCGVGDFNGDGKDDILSYTRGSQGDVYVALSNGYSFGTSAKWHDFFCVGEEVCSVGDFNGDRKDDGITFTRSAYTGEAAGDVYVALSTGSKLVSGPKWHDYFCIGLEVCAAGDFNGDGRGDIATFLRDTQTDARRGDVYVALSGGDGYRFGDVVLKRYLPLVRK